MKKKRGKEEPASSPILGPNEFYSLAIEVGNYRAVRQGQTQTLFCRWRMK